MSKKILITGASGFIGTNLLQFYIDKKYNVLNIDINKPKNLQHLKYWKKIDITKLETLEKAVFDFYPEYVIHLAARTDLNGKSIASYKANTEGVSNLINSLKKCKNIKRVIFASSMLVFQGGMPRNNQDYNPINYYGESKAIGEQLIRNDLEIKFEYAIIRPTSIWGPWFGVPYRNFFDMIESGKYFHLGDKSCTKTYGYIDNTIYQIEQILNSKIEKINKEVFYLGDYKPYPIEVWADEIALELGRNKIKNMPFILIQCLAKLGDILKCVGINFPMTSFRLNNMTTDNIVKMDNMHKIAPHLPVSRKEGIKKTIKWLRV